MGMYSVYTITVLDKNKEEVDFDTLCSIFPVEVRHNKEYHKVTEHYYFNLGNPYYGNSITHDERIKWYSWGEDTKKKSEEFPDYYFIVKCEYEKFEGSSIGYFHNGKAVLKPVEIVWPTVDWDKEF